jgi:1-acyl-sn-glycerol-3-phosphate acyltransferase
VAQRRRRLGFWYWVGIVLLKPPTRLLTRHTWSGREHVPQEGGVLLAVNHVSLADPVVVADFVLYGVRRPPRFMAKSEMFRGRGLVARVMRGAGQIPVHRAAPNAAAALHDAVAALHDGECVVIYPEGTVTRDPDKWPMLAKTGVARLALSSGAPVVPVAQWGAQEIHDSYRAPGLHLLPRKRVRLVAGPPVDLSAYAGKPLTAQVLRAATDDVMAAVTRLLEQLRGQPAPAQPFDPGAGRTRSGDPATGKGTDSDDRRTA